MGCYIEPPAGTKEKWLHENGRTFKAKIDSFKNRPDGMWPVVLLINSTFSAAGVAFSNLEWERFSTPTDPRPRLYYWVDEAKLKDVSPLKDYLK